MKKAIVIEDCLNDYRPLTVIVTDVDNVQCVRDLFSDIDDAEIENDDRCYDDKLNELIAKCKELNIDIDVLDRPIEYIF